MVGTVTDKKVEDGENRIYLDINVTNDDGKTTCPAHAVVALP